MAGDFHCDWVRIHNVIISPCTCTLLPYCILNVFESFHSIYNINVMLPKSCNSSASFSFLDDLYTRMQVIPTHSHLEVEFGATEPTCLAHAHGAWHAGNPYF